MARKSTLLILAVLAAAPLQVWTGGMSKEARAAQLARLKTDLKLTAEQTARTEKLIDELEVLRQSIAAAHNALQGARKAAAARDVVAKKEASLAAAKEAFRKRQEDGFREILTPEQFNKWQGSAIPSPQGPADEHHHHPQPGKTGKQ